MVDGKRRRNRAHKKSAFKPPTKDAPKQEALTTQDLWREIEQLRLEMNGLRAANLAPKFASVNFDTFTNGAGYFDLGFQPYLLWGWATFAASATAVTLGVGFAVFDDSVDGGLFQNGTAIRSNAAGNWRQQSSAHFLFSLASDDITIDENIVIDSFDPGGFSYTIANGPIDIMRAFAVGR